VDPCTVTVPVVALLVVAAVPILFFRKDASRTATRSRWVEIAAVTLFILPVVLLAVPLFWHYGSEVQASRHAKSLRAQAAVARLTDIVEDFDRTTGGYPETLDVLANRAEGEPLVEPGDLISPWGRPYLDDRAGPQNGGRRPDIWVETPDHELICNWTDTR
jgi:hypothetical protein